MSGELSPTRAAPPGSSAPLASTSRNFNDEVAAGGGGGGGDGGGGCNADELAFEGLNVCVCCDNFLAGGVSAEAMGPDAAKASTQRIAKQMNETMNFSIPWD